MAPNKLWTKLFTKKTTDDEVALAFAGAMVIHRNPFEELTAYRNDDELSKEFFDMYVSPFYLNFLSQCESQSIPYFAMAANQLTLVETKKLLGYFDWKCKISGAYFAAIKNYTSLEDIIGIHLLKSEVCYAGTGYCVALAIFGTEKSKDFLNRYLDYYLTRKDLWFDQADALCALEYLDKNESNKHLDKWQEFISNKPNWSFESRRLNFSNRIKDVFAIRNSM